MHIAYDLELFFQQNCTVTFHVTHCKNKAIKKYPENVSHAQTRKSHDVTLFYVNRTILYNFFSYFLNPEICLEKSSRFVFPNNIYTNSKEHEKALKSGLVIYGLAAPFISGCFFLAV